MSGGLMNAIGRGASAAGYAAGDLFAKSALQQSSLENDRQMRLLEFKAMLDDKSEVQKTARANTERAAQATRIDARADELAGQQVQAKRGLVDAGIADPSAWTPEQQAAVDQSLEQDRTAAKGKLRTQAAIETGDIAPKDAAALGQKDEALLYKALWEQSKEEGRNNRSDDRLRVQSEASDARLAAMLAHYEKTGNGNPTREALQFLDGSRKEVTSEAQNLKALYQAQIKDKSKSEVAKIDADYAPKFADVERKRGEIEADYNAMRDRVGLPARTKAAPAPAAPAAAPKPKPAASGTRPPLTAFDRK